MKANDKQMELINLETLQKQKKARCFRCRLPINGTSFPYKTSIASIPRPEKQNHHGSFLHP